MRQHLKRHSGQSMVEFAILAPIFFLLLLGTIDLGRAVYIYNAISDAAREGTRAAVPFDSPLPTNATVLAAVQSKARGRVHPVARPLPPDASLQYPVDTNCSEHRLYLVQLGYRHARPWRGSGQNLVPLSTLDPGGPRRSGQRDRHLGGIHDGDGVLKC